MSNNEIPTQPILNSASQHPWQDLYQTLVQQLRRFKNGRLRFRWGEISLNTPDRQLLEEIILPYFATLPQMHKILFVGCEWYTRGYQKHFKEKEYWTIEIDPHNAKYGAKNHITDSLLNLSNHFGDQFPENHFDLILCNGVLGWGIQTETEVESALVQCSRALREDGVLLLGWNNIPDHRPFPLDQCPSFQQFHPWLFPPFAASEYIIPESRQHTYNFLMKQPA